LFFLFCVYVFMFSLISYLLTWCNFNINFLFCDYECICYSICNKEDLFRQIIKSKSKINNSCCFKNATPNNQNGNLLIFIHVFNWVIGLLSLIIITFVVTIYFLNFMISNIDDFFVLTIQILIYMIIFYMFIYSLIVILNKKHAAETQLLIRNKKKDRITQPEISYQDSTNDNEIKVNKIEEDEIERLEKNGIEVDIKLFKSDFYDYYFEHIEKKERFHLEYNLIQKTKYGLHDTFSSSIAEDHKFLPRTINIMIGFISSMIFVIIADEFNSRLKDGKNVWYWAYSMELLSPFCLLLIALFPGGYFYKRKFRLNRGDFVSNIHLTSVILFFFFTLIPNGWYLIENFCENGVLLIGLIIPFAFSFIGMMTSNNRTHFMWETSFLESGVSMTIIASFLRNDNIKYDPLINISC